MRGSLQEINIRTSTELQNKLTDGEYRGTAPEGEEAGARGECRKQHRFSSERSEEAINRKKNAAIYWATSINNKKRERIFFFYPHLRETGNSYVGWHSRTTPEKLPV